MPISDVRERRSGDREDMRDRGADLREAQRGVADAYEQGVRLAVPLVPAGIGDGRSLVMATQGIAPLFLRHLRSGELEAAKSIVAEAGDDTTLGEVVRMLAVDADDMREEGLITTEVKQTVGEAIGMAIQHLVRPRREGHRVIEPAISVAMMFIEDMSVYFGLDFGQLAGVKTRVDDDRMIFSARLSNAAYRPDALPTAEEPVEDGGAETGDERLAADDGEADAVDDIVDTLSGRRVVSEASRLQASLMRITSLDTLPRLLEQWHDLLLRGDINPTFAFFANKAIETLMVAGSSLLMARATYDFLGDVLEWPSDVEVDRIADSHVRIARPSSQVVKVAKPVLVAERLPDGKATSTEVTHRSLLQRLEYFFEEGQDDRVRQLFKENRLSTLTAWLNALVRVSLDGYSSERRNEIAALVRDELGPMMRRLVEKDGVSVVYVNDQAKRAIEKKYDVRFDQMPGVSVSQTFTKRWGISRAVPSTNSDGNRKKRPPAPPVSRPSPGVDAPVTGDIERAWKAAYDRLVEKRDGDDLERLAKSVKMPAGVHLFLEFLSRQSETNSDAKTVVIKAVGDMLRRELSATSDKLLVHSDLVNKLDALFGGNLLFGFDQIIAKYNYSTTPPAVTLQFAAVGKEKAPVRPVRMATYVENIRSGHGDSLVIMSHSVLSDNDGVSKAAQRDMQEALSKNATFYWSARQTLDPAECAIVDRAIARLDGIALIDKDDLSRRRRLGEWLTKVLLNESADDASMRVAEEITLRYLNKGGNMKEMFQDIAASIERRGDGVLVGLFFRHWVKGLKQKLDRPMTDRAVAAHNRANKLVGNLD